jgi:hypothetical protein
MKANGTLDSNTYMTGSGVAGRVAIWDSASNLTGSNSLLYDTSTGNLSIGGSGSSYRLNVLGVGDSLIGQVITATSGRINIYPYHSATYGGLMESRNLLDTASQPITLSGSNVILLGSSATVTSLAGTGVRMVVTDASGVLSSQAIPVSSVTSVFGRTSAVVAQSGDYTTTLVTEGTNLYYTDARARAAISLTTTGSSGAATYSAGVLNVPNYTLSGLSGSTGVAGEITYWTGASSQGSSSNLFWDAANSRLGIGTNAPVSDIEVQKSASGALGGIITVGNTAASAISNSSSIGFKSSSAFSAAFYSARIASVFNSTSTVDTNLSFFLYDAGATTGTEKMRLRANGNLLLQNGGTFIDSGQRLQVQGTTLLNGNVTFSSSTGMTWDATNSRLGIGTNAPAAPLDVRTASGFDSAIFKSQYTALAYIGNDNTWGWFGTATGGGGTRVSISTITGIRFTVNGNDAGLFTQNRNLILQNGGTFTDSGERLQVIGTAKITGATSIAGVLTVTNQITTGNAQATSGSVVLRTTYSSGNISNIGTNGSSGGVSINYCTYPASTSTADAYLSGIGFQSSPRSSYVVETDHRWLSAAAALVAEGSAVTLTEKMRLYNSGNLVIQNGGTYADTGERLQVTGVLRVNNGPVFVIAPTNTEDGNFLLHVIRPNSGKIFSVKDQSVVEIGNNNFIHPSVSVNAVISRSVSGLFIGQKDASVSTLDIFHLNLGRPNNINNQPALNSTTQGGLVQIIGQFNPNTSVSAPFTSLYVIPAINQTGGANGTTRGLYINPTLTAAADWRSIEWSNNSGYGLYGAGTAQNLLNGKLTVSHTVTTGAFANANTMGVFGSQVLNIPAGTQGVAGAVYAANSGFHYFRFNGNTTLVGDALWAASISVANLQFDTTGTITLPDGAGGGSRPRALSGIQIQMQSAGNNNGTITRAAGLLIQGCYPSTGTGVTTFDEFAGIRINNLTEWGTARITMTDRWGIFQAGADDKNHFNGSVLIGTSTVGGSKLKVSGLPTSATGLTAGDIWNNGGVLNIV